MGLTLMVMAYGFGLACIVNFFIMQLRLSTARAYIQRAERMKAMREGDDRTRAEAAEAEKTRPFKVVILHPDLGIGGAERLVLDAAIGLQRHQRVHPMDVTIVTAHHDKTRCFKETVDGTVKVIVRGNWIPASIMGRCKVLCATLRMTVAAFSTCRATPDVDLFIVDQVAAAMPPLHFFAPCTPILFYCHFPDQKCDPNRNPDGTLKAPPPPPGGVASAVLGTAPPPSSPGATGANAAAATGSSVYTAYRGFFDNVEALSMKCASSIVCNSRFSCQVTKDTFPEIKDRINVKEDVFYPPVAPPPTTTTPSTRSTTAAEEATKEVAAVKEAMAKHATVFVSINRFEKKKNILLAVEAFAQLVTKAEDPASLLLIVAGGYDPRLPENVSYFNEIETTARDKLKIPAEQFLLLQNVSDEEKQALLSGMRALLYTPTNEHFGIVPVEAMMRGKPVIAVNQGGPCESVGDVQATPEEAGGLLCEPTAAAFAAAMQRLASDSAFAEKLGAQGRQRAAARFGIELFSEKLATRLVKLHEDIAPFIWDTYKGAAGAKAEEKADATTAATDGAEPTAQTEQEKKTN